MYFSTRSASSHNCWGSSPFLQLITEILGLSVLWEIKPASKGCSYVIAGRTFSTLLVNRTREMKTVLQHRTMHMTEWWLKIFQIAPTLMQLHKTVNERNQRLSRILKTQTAVELRVRLLLIFFSKFYFMMMVILKVLCHVVLMTAKCRDSLVSLFAVVLLHKNVCEHWVSKY